MNETGTDDVHVRPQLRVLVPYQVRMYSTLPTTDVLEAQSFFEEFSASLSSGTQTKVCDSTPITVCSKPGSLKVHRS
jgi:hypothetical protein